MSKELYSPKGFPQIGYRFLQTTSGWAWEYQEPGQETERTRLRFRTRAEAMRDAANDWSENGSPGQSGNDSLTGTLRRLANLEESK